METSLNKSVLLQPWGGPYGGLPPFDSVTPKALEAAYHTAIDLKLQEILAIANNPEPPTFENTVEAIERSGRAFNRVHTLFNVCTWSLLTSEMANVAQPLAPLKTALDDAIAHNEALFARVEVLWNARARAELSSEQMRLVQVIREGMQRLGASLKLADKLRLQKINKELAMLSATYSQNLMGTQEKEVVFLDGEADLQGLNESQRRTLAAAATSKHKTNQWAVTCTRAMVWPFLTQSTRRDLREKVWRMWMQRGDHRDEFDNKPIVAKILKLRGEKAALLGHPSFAHLALSNRMARTPEAALSMLEHTWRDVRVATLKQIDEFQILANQDADAQGLERFPLEPWDRLHYAEKLRQTRFSLDSEAVRAYLPLEAIMQAMFWSAERLYGLIFKPLQDIALVHPSSRAFEVSRDDRPIGVLYFDLFSRTGKSHGSYQFELRSAEHCKDQVLPIASIVSSFPPPTDGQPVLLPWEYANVFFHEFGHALHMLCNRARYQSLGSMAVAWDFIELPALMNERWLLDREVLQRFARHHETGAPMPEVLIDSIERAAKYDRIFSLNLDFLAPAIVDMRLHLLANGTLDQEIDAVQIEAAIEAELGLPCAWDTVMRVTHNSHCFSGAYAAGLYSYLWADVMAADAAEAFTTSTDGLFDKATAQRWYQYVLSAGATTPAEESFRNFRGRDPDPKALLRRFGLL
jgi:peptidyl-dipeptidase Dcp